VLTLNNIGLNDEGVVVINFAYEGENITFDGEMKLTQEQYIESYHNGDEYLHEFVEYTLQRELHRWMNQ
jgi:hypothetical protein